MKLFAEKGLTGISVLQRLGGGASARLRRGASGTHCLAKAQPTGNCTSGLGLKLELADLSDAELEEVVEELADSTSRSASALLKGAARDALTRALDLEIYARRCDRLVAAYGEYDINLVVSLYPALVAPLSYALQSSELNGAQVADHLFWATSRVLDVFEGSLPLTRKLRILDDEPRGPRSVARWASRTARPSATRRACGSSAGRRTAQRRGGRRSRTNRSRSRPTPRAPRTRGRRRGLRRAREPRTAANCRTVLRTGTKRRRSRISGERIVLKPPNSSRLGFVRVNASSGVWAAAADADPDTRRVALSHRLRRRRGRDRRRGMLSSQPRPCPRAVWPRQWRAAGAPALPARAARGKTVTLAGLRRLLARAGLRLHCVLCLMLQMRVHLGGWPIQRPSADGLSPIKARSAKSSSTRASAPRDGDPMFRAAACPASGVSRRNRSMTDAIRVGPVRGLDPME